MGRQLGNIGNIDFGYGQDGKPPRLEVTDTQHSAKSDVAPRPKLRNRPQVTENSHDLRLVISEIRTQAALSRLRICHEVSAYFLETEKLMNKLRGFTKREKAEVRMHNTCYLNALEHVLANSSPGNLSERLNKLARALRRRGVEKATRVSKPTGEYQADSVLRISREVASFLSYLTKQSGQPEGSLVPSASVMALREDYQQALERSFHEGLVAMYGTEEKLEREKKQWIKRSYKVMA